MIKDYLNKRIPTPIAIGIILILVILVGSLTWRQYGEMWRETSELPEIELPEKKEATSSLNQLLELSNCNKDSNCILVDHKSCSGATMKISINADYEYLYSSTPELQHTTGEICNVIGISSDEDRQINQGEIPAEAICINNICRPKYERDETPDWETFSGNGFVLKYHYNFKPTGVGEGQISFLGSGGAPTLSNLLIFFPAVDSLDDYLSYHTEKSGTEIVNKWTKAFGEVENGLFYITESHHPWRWTGYIFNNGPFTYHFWIDNMHRIKTDAEFLTMLSTLKLSDPVIKVSQEEIDDERVYKDEDYGIEFRYPIEWESLALQSIKTNNEGDKVYAFKASGRLVSTLYYHQLSNTIAIIKKGEEHSLSDGSRFHQDILQVYKDGETKTLYTSPIPGSSMFGERIGYVSFSPNGEYIVFDIWGYEWSSNGLFNIEDSLNIIDKYNILFFNSYKDVYWSRNNKVLAVRSYQSDLGGEGTDGLFVSDYDNPERLNEVYSLAWEEHICGTRFYDIYFSGDNTLFFSLALKEMKEGATWEETKCLEEIIKKYRYNVKTKELKEVK